MIRAFIVGMSRSGTTWLANCLNKHSKVLAFGETGFWGRNFVNPSRGNKYSLKDYDKLIDKLNMIEIGVYDKTDLNPFISHIIAELKNTNCLFTPKELFDYICKKLLDKEGKKFVVEKTPHHINWIDRIVKFYPEVKFLVLYRNPYDFMLSYKHQGDRKPEPLKREFKKIYHPIACAWVYKQYANSILNISKYTKNYLLIKFERIKNEPEQVLSEVQKFLGIEEEEIVLPPSNTSFPHGKRKELENIDIFWMNLIAEKEIKSLGYDIMKINISKLDVIKSFTYIPIWLLNAFPVIYKKTASPFSYIVRWLFSLR